jgi:transposase
MTFRGTTGNGSNPNPEHHSAGVAGGIYGGVDTHGDTIHVAVVDEVGRHLDDREFATTPVGYQRALAFLASHGDIAAIGVEGTSSYGSGFTRAALEQGIAVLEVTRPERAERRRLGKSDPIDAYQAANAAMSQQRVSPVKGSSIIGIRALHNTRRSAMRARTVAVNQIHHQLVTAPAAIREKYRSLNTDQLVTNLARLRLPRGLEPTDRAVLIALRTLAARCQDLQRQHAQLGVELDALVTLANPGLRGVHGVGPDTAAQLLITAGDNPDRLRSDAAFAALCGASPISASSGKTNRHRLNRGGDRAANSSLHRIALVRMRNHQPTRDYVARQRAAGRTTRDILRMLKRAIAREIFRCLTRPVLIPAIDDLRPLRRSKNITLTTAANHFSVWPATISELERGRRRDDTLTNAYRDWLHAT